MEMFLSFVLFVVIAWVALHVVIAVVGGLWMGAAVLASWLRHRFGGGRGEW